MAAVGSILEAVTAADLHVHHIFRDKLMRENVGTRIQRHVGHC